MSNHLIIILCKSINLPTVNQIFICNFITKIKLLDASNETSKTVSSHRRSSFHFSFSKLLPTSTDEKQIEKPSRSCRTRSISTTISTNNNIQMKLNFSRRRKSCSTAGLTIYSNYIQINESYNSDNNLINNLEKVF